MNICDNRQNALNRGRVHFLDNLRTFMIFLVVLCHAGGVYESSGTWASFWIVDDPATNDLAGLVNIVVDIFMMATIFFVSGFFVPGSVQGRSVWAFLRSKCKRLILPWLIAVLTLIPLYKVIFLYSRNLPQERWTTYFHWSNGIWGQNWLWFLPVLFLFNALYLLFARAGIRFPNVSLRRAIPLALLMGLAYSFGMDVFGLRGWTKIGVLDFQNERIAIYFMAFLLGALCFKRRVFDVTPKRGVFYHVVNSIAWIPVMVYIFFLLYPWFHPGRFIVSRMVDRAVVWSSFHVSLLCLMYIMIETFRRYLDKSGPLCNVLSRSSYSVYIIHVIVMGPLALIMLDSPIPSLLKYVILTVSTWTVSNLIAYAYRRLTALPALNHASERSMMRTATTVTFLVLLLVGAGCGKRKDPQENAQAPHMSLHIAALQGNLDAIRQHIDAGTNLNGRDAYGSTALIVAATFGRTDVARALVDAGADMTITNREGSTPLHIAAFLCRTEIVRILLDKGADATVSNGAGRTALESVSSPFDEVKGIYDGLAAALGPLGLKLDYQRIKATRPEIAEMLR